jgi:hypothetical protein
VSKSSKKFVDENLHKHDPLELLHEIRKTQSALTALANDDSESAEQQESLDEFLSHLPRLWKQGEARPTHTPAPKRERNYCTRPDPFEGDWKTILEWLQEQPDATATSLLERLKSNAPGKYQDKHLRTLQRRVSEWRHIMAKQLVTGTTALETQTT